MDIESVARDAGFKKVSRSDDELCIEKKPVRVAIKREGKGLILDASLRRHPGILDFLAANYEAMYRVSGERIHMLIEVTCEEDFRASLDRLSDLSPLIVNGDVRVSVDRFLQPVPAPEGPAESPAAIAGLLSAHLGSSRAFATRASMQTTAHHLFSLGISSIYTIRPRRLAEEPGEVIDFLSQKSASLSCAVILCNLDFFTGSNTAWSAPFLAAVETLSQQRGDGARIIVTEMKPDAAHMPVLALPSPDHTYRIALEKAGLPSDNADIKSFSLLLKTHEPADAIDMLREARSHADGATDSARSTLRYQDDDAGLHDRSFSREEVEAIYEKARALFDRRVVGQKEAKERLVPLLVSHFCSARGRFPLVTCMYGPSATGKSHFAEVIAEFLADFYKLPGPKFMTENGATLSDEHGWRWISPGAGFVGSDSQPGILDRLRKNGPGFCLSIDEIDKAPENGQRLQSSLVSWFDSGFSFRNGKGEQRRIPPGVFCLTMNDGPDGDGGKQAPIGFGISNRDLVREHYQEHFESTIQAPLRGRIKSPTFFPHLTPTDLTEIAYRALSSSRESLLQRGFRWDLAKGGLRAEAGRIAERAELDTGARRIRELVEQRESEIEQQNIMGK